MNGRVENSVTSLDLECILIEDVGCITWITLNRPARANALSQQTLHELSVALRHLRTAGNPVLGIRGAGEGFSSGYDLGEPNSPEPLADRERLHGYVNRYLEIWDHPKPIIAAIHGYCLAGATQLAVWCDLTLVAHDAVIGEPPLPLGGGFIAPMWAPLVGPKRAKEMSFIAGNTISGKVSSDWGWANRSVPPEELWPTAEELAYSIAQTPSDVLRIKKLAVNRVLEVMGVRTSAVMGAEWDALLHASTGVAELRRLVDEVGVKEAIRVFRDASSKVTDQ